MTDNAMAELAEAASRARRLPAMVVPTYEAIVTGSAILRFAAILLFVFGVADWVLGGTAAGMNYIAGRDRLAAVNHQIEVEKDSHAEPWRIESLEQDARICNWQIDIAIGTGISVFMFGVAFMVAGAMVRMVAFVALAIRDVARNSFLLRMETIMHGREVSPAR